MSKSQEEKDQIISNSLLTATCKKCGHVWVKRIQKRSRSCPNCNCKKYDTYVPPKKAAEAIKK